MHSMAWPPRSVVNAKETRRPARMWPLRVSVLISSVQVSRADMLVVELVPVACCQAKPVTQPKRVAMRGHGVSCLMSHPHACKVTPVTSPSLEVLTRLSSPL